MDVYTQMDDIRRLRWADPAKTWGLVPTMGFLHDAHLNLVRQARAENDAVGISIFVNPAQFNNPNDLAAYPRDLDRDLNLLEKAGAEMVWTPSPDIVYQPGYQTYVDLETIPLVLEGASRPGHFKGVATVVTKLFNVFAPTRAYFGQKDAQQVIVIQQLVKDLNFNLEVVVCPTTREPDGLAMSSRNVRLTSDHRRQAPCLYQALSAARADYDSDERDASRLRNQITLAIEKAPDARIDYVSVAHPETLQELDQVTHGALVSVAVFFGEVRLIDNIQLD